MEKLISIVGLTSSGKSSLGIELAKLFNGEIVSADSRQVYRGLDWCSGKVTPEEQMEVPHHLLDVVSLGTQFTLFDYQKMAYEEIEKILSKGKTPFLVGGTGLYSRSIVEGYNLTEDKPDEELREELSKLSLDELKEICHQKNIDYSGEQTVRRLIRLIEKNNSKNQNEPKYNVLQIGINWPREEIYERIKLRLNARMPNMINEIKSLLDSGANREFLIKLGLEAKYVTFYLENQFESYEQFLKNFSKKKDILQKDNKHGIIKKRISFGLTHMTT